MYTPYFRLETPLDPNGSHPEGGHDDHDRHCEGLLSSANNRDRAVSGSGFGWKWYTSRVLPSELSLVPYVFNNKIVRQTVAISRLLGVRGYNYFDDCRWTMEKGRDTTTVGNEFLRTVVWNSNTKCVWDPSTEAVFPDLRGRSVVG